MGKGGYLGGSTIIRPGSDWFSDAPTPRKPKKTKRKVKFATPRSKPKASELDSLKRQAQAAKEAATIARATADAAERALQKARLTAAAADRLAIEREALAQRLDLAVKARSAPKPPPRAKPSINSTPSPKPAKAAKTKALGAKPAGAPAPTPPSAQLPAKKISGMPKGPWGRSTPASPLARAAMRARDENAGKTEAVETKRGTVRVEWKAKGVKRTEPDRKS